MATRERQTSPRRSARRCAPETSWASSIATTTKPGSPRWRRSTSRAMCSTNPAASSPMRRSSRSSTRRRPMVGRSRPSRSIGSPRPQQTLADREGELLETDGLPDHLERRCPEPHQAHAVPAGRGRQAAGIAPDLQQCRRAGEGLPGRHPLRRAHRLRRQGPARAHRLRQRRDDPLCLRPAHVPPEAPAQRALYQTGRAHLPPERRGPAGLRLRLRSGREHPRHSRPHAGQRHPQQSGSRDRRRSGAGATADQRQCAQPPLRLRPDLPPALRHRPRMRPPARRRARGRTSRAAPTSPRRAPTPSSYRYDAMGNMLRLEHRNDAGGFHPRVHGGDGQQPPAPHADRRRPATTTPSTPTATCARRRPRATSSGTTPTR